MTTPSNKISRKREAEYHGKVDPATLTKVRTIYGTYTYVPTADLARLSKFLPMYKKNGRSQVSYHKSHKYIHGRGWWEQDRLHPENICPHPLKTWKPVDVGAIPGEKFKACPICTPSYFTEEK